MPRYDVPVLAQNRTVLLLDDFPDAAEAVAGWLELDGWQPTCVFTIAQALLCLERDRPAALVMEPYLRSGNAMEVARVARSLGTACPLIVSMSAAVRSGDLVAYEPTLFDFNLVKPIVMAQLSDILARHSGRRNL
ncbi:hypothetical protein ACQ859_16660 [Roseateles chitinivorans]|uniref:hypothetical protein n=1 Tax=Roseateles chitinivorans TaxID=2917965 RepID=UPI003D666C67